MLDGDCLVDTDTLRAAIEQAKRGSWIVPHKTVLRLDQSETEKFYETGEIPANPKLCRKPYTGVAGGGCFVINRWNYEKAGGLDERFTGWGGEDYCFGLVADEVLGKHTRHEANLYHLYHPYQATRTAGFGKNNRNVGSMYKVKPSEAGKVLHWIAAENRAALTGSKQVKVFLICKNLEQYQQRMGKAAEFGPKWQEVGQWNGSPNKFGVSVVMATNAKVRKLPFCSPISKSDFELYLSRLSLDSNKA